MSAMDDWQHKMNERMRHPDPDSMSALRERNAKLVAAFMLKLREENECNGPCADNQKCGCWDEMQNYIALAEQSTEKP